MSQRMVEAVLGRLLCDEAFRQEFYKDAQGAAARFGFQLTAEGLSGLRSIKLVAVRRLASKLDDRIRRAYGPLKG